MEPKHHRRRTLTIVAVLLLAGAAITLAFVEPQERIKAALEAVRGLGAWGPVVFVMLYVIACLLFLPGSLLTLGAGAVFGVVKGTVLVSLGATAGAAAAFLVGRHLVRGWVEARLRGHERFRFIDAAVAREGWRMVLLTRLSPVFPFNLLNYAFGLTRISFREYLLASWAGMLPGTLLYVWLGAAAGELALAGTHDRRTPAEWILFGVGLAATVAVTLLITRIARRALQQRLGPEQP